MTDSLDQLRRDFEAFRRECIDLAILINTFEELFVEQQQQGGYADVAPVFLSNLNRWLIDLFYIKAFRILDKEESKNRKNLTASHLVNSLKKNNIDTKEIEKILNRMNNYKIIIERTRHRAVAHADLRTVTEQDILGEHEESCFDTFRNDLQEFCDEFGRAVGCGPSDFINIAPGDVRDLIRTLEKNDRD